VFPVTIGGVVDTFEGPSPLIHDPPPCKDPQPEINRRCVDSSPDASSACPHCRSEDNRHLLLSSHMQHSTASPTYVVCSDSLDSSLNSESRSSRASCPDVGNLSAAPQLSSRRCRKRRHRGRHHSHHSDNAMVTESRHHDVRLPSPSTRTTALGSSSLPTVVPCAMSYCAGSGVVSKSAPCATASFMSINGPVPWDLESGNAGRVSQTSSYTLESPPLRVCSPASPDRTPTRDQRRSTRRSWYSQGFPFFSSLAADDGVTEVRCILLAEILS
jgi:hypothetical protein